MGLIFYANIVKIEEDYLFPHDPVQVSILFVSWINLDFGINTCFASGLTGYSHDTQPCPNPIDLVTAEVGVITVTMVGQTRVCV